MEVLTDLIVTLAIAAVVLYVNSRLHLPSIIGFLIAGVLVGPSGIELISTVEEVNVMAEIGILLLLFSIGIEFSLDKLIEARKLVLVGGALQVGITILIVFGGSSLFGLTWQQSLFIGMLLAMSSTAIVLQMFQEKGWMSTPFGKASVSILIFQDIIIIPMMLVTPYLASTPVEGGKSGWEVLLGLLLIVVVVIAARKLVPRLIRSIVYTHNQDLFLITILVICFATAFITQQLGLKLALGAFLAGLVISESEFSYEALKNIMPFKKIFTAIFFVSVGMLLDLGFVYDNFFLILGISAGVMFLKFLIIVPITNWLGIGIRSAVISGLTLFQVGEFAFILSKTGLDYQVLTEFTYQMFLAISIFSMIISILVIGQAPSLASRFVEVPLWKSWLKKMQKSTYLPANCVKVNHTVIIGFGPGGRKLAEFLQAEGKALSIVELNERNIMDGDEALGDVIIGDATDDTVLYRAAVPVANRVIITVPEVGVAENILIKARKMNHEAEIMVRTRYVSEIERIEMLGANKVFPAEISVADSLKASMAAAS